jgi:hypothetical protein
MRLADIGSSQQKIVVRSVGVMAIGACQGIAAVNITRHYFVPVMTVKAKFLRFRYEEEGIGRTVWIVADQATARDERAVAPPHRLKLVALQADLFTGRKKPVGARLMTGIAETCRIRPVLAGGLLRACGRGVRPGGRISAAVDVFGGRHSVKEETEHRIPFFCFAPAEQEHSRDAER